MLSSPLFRHVDAWIFGHRSSSKLQTNGESSCCSNGTVHVRSLATNHSTSTNELSTHTRTHMCQLPVFPVGGSGAREPETPNAYAPTALTSNNNSGSDRGRSDDKQQLETSDLENLVDTYTSTDSTTNEQAVSSMSSSSESCSIPTLSISSSMDSSPRRSSPTLPTAPAAVPYSPAALLSERAPPPPPHLRHNA